MYGFGKELLNKYMYNEKQLQLAIITIKIECTEQAAGAACYIGELNLKSKTSYIQVISDCVCFHAYINVNCCLYIDTRKKTRHGYKYQEVW